MHWPTGCVSRAAHWYLGPDGTPLGSESAASPTRAPGADSRWSCGTPALASTAGVWDTCGSAVAGADGLCKLNIHHPPRPGASCSRLSPLDVRHAGVRAPGRSSKLFRARSCTVRARRSPAELSPAHYAVTRQAAQAELACPRRSFAGAAPGARLHGMMSTGSG
eukprot:scaffold1619_cov121-Isochrysis_galbana.AAC.10